MRADANSGVVADMASYYARRAAEYELVYHKPERQTELRQLEAWLPNCFVDRRVLEIACGTGWWTPFGAARCVSWLATDLNPETMAIAAAKRLPESKIDFRTVDAYSLAELGDARFDAAFAGCWWSHVPLARLPAWLQTLHDRLDAGARVVMLDNSYVQTSSTPISRVDADDNGYQIRTLGDGSTHEVLKNFPDAHSAIAALGPRACDANFVEHGHYWTLEYLLE